MNRKCRWVTEPVSFISEIPFAEFMCLREKEIEGNLEEIKQIQTVIKHDQRSI